MRRMRDLPWQYYLLAIPAVAGAIAIQSYVRKSGSEKKNPDLTSTMKPSQFKHDADAESEGRRETAGKATNAKAANATKQKDGEYAAVDEQQKAEELAAAHEAEYIAEIAKQRTNDKDEKKAPAAKKATDESWQFKDEAHAKNEAPFAAPASPSHVIAATESEPLRMLAENAKPNQCATIEYRGDGPAETKVTKQEWEKVLATFHGAKGDLLAWLNKHRKEFPTAVAERMENQVRTLRIQRPGSQEEPDLAWRGIAAWTQDATGAPLLRMGNGFVKMVLKEAERGRFELTRLVAQAWAPCELQRTEASHPWEKLLSCLGVTEDRACAAGTNSESGWAVSTALAVKVAKPACTIPAFTDPNFAACLRKMPLPLSLAEAESPTKPEWKEARR